MRRVLDSKAWSSDEQQIFAIAALPLPSASNYVLTLSEGATASIRLVDMRQPRNALTLNLGTPPCGWCSIFGIAWLPDGSGFLFSRHEQHAGTQAFRGVLYKFDFAKNKSTEILRLPNELIGRVAISPDGKRIAFERASRMDTTYPLGYAPLHGSHLLCPCSVWVMGIEGSEPYQLVADGRAPSWQPQIKAP